MTSQAAERRHIAGLAGIATGVAATALLAFAAPLEAGTTVEPRAPAARASHTAAPYTVDEARPLYTFVDPVAGYEIVSPFGPRRLPWEEHGRLHAGVDVAAPHGYPVQAAADGVVLSAGTDGGYGRLIDIRHVGGLITRYAHLGAIEGGIQPGLMVRAGETIGLIGASGTSTGAHLHFEIRDDRGRPLNPEAFLGRQFAQADDLPLAAAARIPRRMRVAHVSYIPRKKRELMEAREAEQDTGPVELKPVTPDERLRLTRAAGLGAVKMKPAQPDTPITIRRPDPFGAGEDMPGWPASGG